MHDGALEGVFHLTALASHPVHLGDVKPGLGQSELVAALLERADCLSGDT